MGRAARALLAASVLAVGLTACGGGGVVPVPGVDIRPLSADFSNRKAVAYSPFRSANRDTETITPAMIRQDLALLAQGGFTLLRVFDSSDAVAKLLLQIITDDKLDFKVYLGVYLVSESSPFLSDAVKAANRQLNLAEVARGVALAKQFSSTVVAVSIGNETMVSWSFVPSSTAVVAAHIKSVRDQTTQPVTTDDNWAFFAKKAGEPNDPRVVIEGIDFIAMHTYPLLDTVPPAVPNWDWQQQAVPESQRAVAMMNAAIESAKGEYAAVRAHLDSLGQQAKPIVIGETGWKAEPVGNTANRAHPVNQKMYVDRLKAWSDQAKASGAGPVSIVYFEAFDEPWKSSDDKWGLFTVARKARYVIQDPALYPASLWDMSATYTDANAVYAQTIVENVVTANRYTLYADAVTAGEARIDPIPRPDALADLKLKFFGWDSPPNAFAGEFVGTAADGEGFRYVEVGPSPSAYGWGFFATNNSSTDLSQFEAAGRLNLRIKTIYPGKLRFGFLTGSGITAYDVYITLSNTNADGYGYRNDGQWHDVSIPISALKAGGAPSFGNTSATARFDLTKVTNPFVMNDVYDATGNTSIKGNKTPIYIDNIYWSK